MTTLCRHCQTPIDPARVSAELHTRTRDIPATCASAARAAVYCGLDCALGELVGEDAERSDDYGA
jgi:hypothetical protein